MVGQNSKFERGGGRREETNLPSLPFPRIPVFRRLIYPISFPDLPEWRTLRTHTTILPLHQQRLRLCCSRLLFKHISRRPSSNPSPHTTRQSGIMSVAKKTRIDVETKVRVSSGKALFSHWISNSTSSSRQTSSCLRLSLPLCLAFERRILSGTCCSHSLCLCTNYQPSSSLSPPHMKRPPLPPSTWNPSGKRQ